MANVTIGFHESSLAGPMLPGGILRWETQFTYTFQNFFHPLVGDLIGKLQTDSLSGMLDAKWQDSLTIKADYFRDLYHPPDPDPHAPVQVKYFPKEIEVSLVPTGGPYANYNWELFFHIPLTIAVHLSKNQRFAEAQRWFHYILDPTSNDPTIQPPARFWKFLGFRGDKQLTIDQVVRLLSDPNTPDKDTIVAGYTDSLLRPFQPHVVARTRPLAYQYCVAMKYLDNLIAWGDQLFQQDTVESINEATQAYVLAANLLGERPQKIPPLGTPKAQTFQTLKAKMGRIGDAFVDMEAQAPFNVAALQSGTPAARTARSSPLFGIVRTLYFGLPPNDKLLSYWDAVAERLFRIRHGMNFQGVVRPLALFDPPIDPAILVKAAAAGIDIASIVTGLNQPVGPTRSLFLIQKALELCSEVRALGNALLSALEKGDAEHLAMLRQGHEIQIQKMMLDVRFVQWRAAQEATRSLLTSRKTALERLTYYQHLLGLPPDKNVPEELVPVQSTNPDDPPTLTQEAFEEAYSALVLQYDVSQGDNKLTLQPPPDVKLSGDSSPAQQSGASGQGRLYLNTSEDAELNSHLPTARDTGLSATVCNALASAFAPVPDPGVNLHFWGIGGHVKLNVGTALVAAAKIGGDVLGITAGWERDQAGMAARTAANQRRADEWNLQYNLAARELMQNGRQILTSLIAEEIAHHDYLNVKQQIANAQEVSDFLQGKFTNEELYVWMQGEISRLYYEYYRFAVDTARRAERTMKQELMRPELDSRDFIKFNYWDVGRKGLLSGEALHLDVKQLEMAYHDNNQRELELTRHVSLRQLDPVALLTLKATGSCQASVPEWLYDLDCPGHYMRRIKSVALTIPSVIGPYTSVNCTLSLLRSSVRKSALAADDYGRRQDSDDDRFIDYVGAVQSIVTSSGQNDSGMFETNLRDERFLPFEGAGAVSTWKLELPRDFPLFDYATISDVILHVRYTARQGVDPAKVKATLDDLFEDVKKSNLALLFSLRYDFPTQWAAFVSGKGDFTAIVRRDFFPYFAQGKEIIPGDVVLYAHDVGKHRKITVEATWETDLNDRSKAEFIFTTAEDTSEPRVVTRSADREVFLIVPYTLAT